MLHEIKRRREAIHVIRKLNLTLRPLLLVVGLVTLSAANAEIEGPVLVFGGTSGVGLETVKLLRERDVSVTVFVRPTSNRAKLEPLGITYVVGDALNGDDVVAAYATDKYAMVLSSLGGRRGEPRPDFIGNRNITNAAMAAGIGRIVQVSSVGAGETREKPAEGSGFMADVLYQKTLGEDHLIASDLNYTIIRPGGLLNGLATGGGILSEEHVTGAINRADVAALIIQVLQDDSTIGKVYHVVDPKLPPRSRD